MLVKDAYVQPPTQIVSFHSFGSEESAFQQQLGHPGAIGYVTPFYKILAWVPHASSGLCLPLGGFPLSHNGGTEDGNLVKLKSGERIQAKQSVLKVKD